jgi:hypothetical protein
LALYANLSEVELCSRKQYVFTGLRSGGCTDEARAECTHRTEDEDDHHP